ncbi:hypothetical protein CGRA01v4_00587 [Colletotrichum graminicola]|nr:hypothetical protein CGRA01v4_00587 [Colletotrichum graminicola]
MHRHHANAHRDSTNHALYDGYIRNRLLTFSPYCSVNLLASSGTNALARLTIASTIASCAESLSGERY